MKGQRIDIVISIFVEALIQSMDSECDPVRDVAEILTASITICAAFLGGMLCIGLYGLPVQKPPSAQHSLRQSVQNKALKTMVIICLCGFVAASHCFRSFGNLILKWSFFQNFLLV